MHLTLINNNEETKHFCEKHHGVGVSCDVVFCDRDSLQQSFMRASLKPCSVPSQRTCHPKTSVLGLGQFLFLL